MAILTSPRIIGQVTGDLTGSVFSPQVISVANITTGTLGVAHGGTGLTIIGSSGSVLTSNGTSLVYAPVVGGSGISQSEVSGAINILTASISASYATTSFVTSSISGALTGALLDYATIEFVTASISGAISGGINLTGYATETFVTSSITGALNNYAELSGDTFTGPLTASQGVSASVFVLSDGYELSSSGQLGASVDLTSYATIEFVTSSVSGAITGALFNYIASDSSASLDSLAANTGSFAILSASAGINFNTVDGTYIRATNGHARIYAASNAFITASNNLIGYAGTDIELKADDNILLSSSNNTIINAPEIEITGALKVTGIIYGDGTGLTNVGGGITANQATTAYDRLRFVTASVLDGQGVVEIDLTSQATSGSTYFNTSSLTQVTVDVMVDTDGDGRYKYDLIAVELFESSSNLWVRVDAPAAATRNYRLIAINEASNKFTFGS